MFKRIVASLAILAATVLGDGLFAPVSPAPMGDKEMTLLGLNATTGGPYTYYVSSHRFVGTGYDGSYIDTTGCCSGQSGSCRNNVNCECQKSVGPLPRGTYSLGNMFTYKGMNYCYELFPSSSNNMCGRSGFLIHGGNCGGNPSEGCIVIESESTRYKIKSGATLYVK
jgi:hypothetical protein